jgi:putative tricarboxylic transport membrane protein
LRSWPGWPGAVLALVGIAIGLEALTFEVGFLADPVGPKALPGLAAVMLLVAGSIEMRRVGERWDVPSGAALRRLVGAALLLGVYPFALGFLGFVLSTTLVVGGLALLFGAPRAPAAASAAALSVVLWVLFVVGLSLPLPIGSLWTR